MLQVLVFLYHADASSEAFRNFEMKALSIVRSHGGKLVTAFVPQKGQHEDVPDEIHLIEFPSQTAFEAYRNDAKTTALARERDSIISKTVIWRSDEFISYLTAKD